MKRPAVFFDRDNTLIVSDGYLGDPAQVMLVDGAADAVAKARQYGFKVFTVSNQSGVARGLFDEAAVRAVNARMDEMLQRANGSAVIQQHEFCPHHPEAPLEAYRLDCEDRKPRPGMIRRLARQFNLDLHRSWVVGDTPRDIEAGKAAGCRTILFTDPNLPASPSASEESAVTPDFTVSSLREAVNIIAREAFKPTSPPTPRVTDSASTAIVAAAAATAARIIEASGNGNGRSHLITASASGTAVADEETEPADSSTADVSSDESATTGGGSLDEPAPESHVPLATYSDDEDLDGRPSTEPVELETVATETRLPIIREIEAPEPEPESLAADPTDDAPTPAPASDSPSTAAVATAAATAPDDTTTTTAPAQVAVVHHVTAAKLEALTHEILSELRRRREESTIDFSVSKLMAGIVQVLALGTLLFAFFYRDTPATFQSLALLSIAFQTLTTSLLLMGSQR